MVQKRIDYQMYKMSVNVPQTALMVLTLLMQWGSSLISGMTVTSHVLASWGHCRGKTRELEMLGVHDLPPVQMK